jgi:hypothetical protein
MTIIRTLLAGLAAGITMFFVGAVFHFLIPIVKPSIPAQYQNVALFRTWTGWTATYMVVHPFLFGFVIAVIFVGLRRSTHFPTGMRGGLIYGALVFLVGSLPVFLLIFASLQLSVEIIVSWMVQNLVQHLIAGMVIVKWTPFFGSWGGIA